MSGSHADARGVGRRGRGRGAPGRRRRTPLLAPVAAVLAVAVLAGGTTVALWRTADRAGGGVVTAGDLDLTTGTATYQQVTPGLATPGAPTTDPATLLTMPGDVVAITVPVTVDLEGDNLAADLVVTVDAPSAGGARTSATYRVHDSAGDPVTSAAAVGTPVTLAGLTGSDAGTRRTWSVVITVAVLDDYQWVTPASPAVLTDWTAGRVTVRLDQVRSGPGYAMSEVG